MLEAAGIWKDHAGSGQSPRISDAVDLLVDRAKAGDELAILTFDRAGRALGTAIASLTTLFAPPSVILAGVGIRAGEFLLGPLREVVRKDTPASLSSVTQVTVHEWSDDTWARGAAAMTLRDLYGMPWEAMAPVMRI
jgi:predicted NBD/HSP70 family sugar kinase